MILTRRVIILFGCILLLYNRTNVWAAGAIFFKKVSIFILKLLTFGFDGAIMLLKKGKEIPKQIIKPQQKGKVNNYDEQLQSRTDD